jgi:hypothetical protein
MAMSASIGWGLRADIWTREIIVIGPIIATEKSCGAAARLGRGVERLARSSQ